MRAAMGASATSRPSFRVFRAPNNRPGSIGRILLDAGLGDSWIDLRALPNVDLQKPVTLIPKIEMKGDVKRTSVIIAQGGKGVKWEFTKDAPGDLPPMKQIKVKGKDVWDDSDQLAYFEKMITDINNKLSAVAPTLGSDAGTDDLPF
jgi:hypothetical protein